MGKVTELFGTRLKTAREAIGLSQEKLSELLSVDRTTVARYELGGLKPGFDKLDLIAEAVEQPLWWFFVEGDVLPIPQIEPPTREVWEQVATRLKRIEDKLNIQSPD